MCFRPPSAAKPKKCPSCGSMNPPTRTTCLKCNADLGSEKDEEKEDTK